MYIHIYIYRERERKSAPGPPSRSSPAPAEEVRETEPAGLRNSGALDLGGTLDPKTPRL